MTTGGGSIGLDDEQQDLAEMVASVAKRYRIGSADVRERMGELREAKVGQEWSDLVDQGLHSIHLTEADGGADGDLIDLATVVEQLGAMVHPGPVLATLTTSAVCAYADKSSARDRVITAFAAGATGAMALAAGIEAHRVDNTWQLRGTISSVLGAAQAHQILVRADVVAESHDQADTTAPQRQSLWVLLAPGAGIVITPVDTADLTRGVAEMSLVDVVVTDDDCLSGIDASHALAIVVALTAAESSGIASRCVSIAIEHARLREQFGRTLSSFQSMQQRLSLMHVRAEGARAAAWDAVSTLSDPDAEQRDLASAAAAITTLNGAVENAIELVLTLGAMGFTWENEAHLLWRRALANVAIERSGAAWQLRLGSLAQQTKRTLRLADEAKTAHLRSEIEGLLMNAGPRAVVAEASSAWAPAMASDWQRNLANSGLVSPHLPRPWGRGADPIEQDVIAEVFRRADVAQPDIVIGNWVVPTIIMHGTAAQRDRYVTQTLSGDIVWCQLFSEPGAGSDLASVTTRATRVEGGWSVTGQKVWNSLADVAQWGAALVRTDLTVSKHKGLSYLLIDMASVGVTVRPIVQATGLAEFCEVFLEDVFVPDECVVGKPGDGWTLATTTLANERLRMGEALGHGSSDRLREAVLGARDDATRALAQAALGRAVARESVLAALAARGAIQRMHGRDGDSETSVLKVANTIAQRDGSLDLMSFIDQQTPGQATLSMNSEIGDVLDHLGLPAVLLGGGTPDIQLGIIARKVLALP